MSITQEMFQKQTGNYLVPKRRSDRTGPTNNQVGQKKPNNEPMLISIKGNIGAGKSELLAELSGQYPVIQESVNEWEECLTNYYDSPSTHAYQLHQFTR